MATTMTLNAVHKSGGSDTILVTVDWLSHVSAGTASASTADFNYMGQPISNYLQGRELIMAQTAPGSATPSSYSMTVKDDQGQDLFGNGLATRSTSAAESEFTYDTAVHASRIISGDLAMAITGAGNSKTGKLILTFE